MDMENKKIKVELEEDDDCGPSSKRVKIEKEFEYVPLGSDVTNNDDFPVEIASVSILQTAIDLITIKGEAEDSYESYSPLETKELFLDDCDIYSSTAERDPLLPDESTGLCCLQCDYTTNSDEDLKKHIDEMHTLQSCSDCSYTTFKKKTLQQHRRLKHGLNRPLLPCLECPFTSSTKRELKQHQKSEHTNQKLPKPIFPQTGDTLRHEFNSLEGMAGNEMDIILSSQNINEIETTTSNNSTIQVSSVHTVCENLEGINKVDNLLNLEFRHLSWKVQQEVIRLGPHRPLDIEIVHNSFSIEECFNKIEWLTVSETSKNLYCFYCLLFGGEVTWSKTGCRHFEHILEKAAQHESTAVHINNAVRFKTFGKTDITARLSIHDHQQHNEAVEKNRHIVNKVIRSLKFCLTRELPLPDEDEDTKCMFNRKVFLGLIALVEKYDNVMYEHTHGSPQCDYTSEPIQNELIDCMYHIYKEQLLQDVEKASFVSVQVEQVTSTTMNQQFAIILRYVKDNVSVERLHSFVEVFDNTGSGLASAIKKELEPYKLQSKLIAQTFEVTVMPKGRYGGVHKCLQEAFPNASFVHSYAHTLDHVVGEACALIRSLRLFFGGIALFSEFFACPSRRTQLLASECSKVELDGVESKWSSISDTVKSVHDNQLALIACFETIRDELGWSHECIYGAVRLLDMLMEREFLFFLNFFYEVLGSLEEFNKAFLARTSSGDVTLLLHDFESKLKDIVQVIRQTKPSAGEFESILDEACDIIVAELRERLEATDHMVAFYILDPNQFKGTNFPSDHLQTLICRYPVLMQGKLSSELRVLHRNQIFAGVKNASTLMQVIADNELGSTFSELRKLLEIALVIPAAPIASDGSGSTSKKLKEFKINDWYPEKVVIIATFNIHWDVISKIPNFYNRVIDYFARIGGRQELLHIGTT